MTPKEEIRARQKEKLAEREREAIQVKTERELHQQAAAREGEESREQAIEAGQIQGPTMGREGIESKQSFEIQQQHRRQEAEEETQQAIERGELAGPSMGREDIERKAAFQIEQQHAKEEAAEETRQAIERGELQGPTMSREEIERRQAFQIEQMHAKEQEAQERLEAIERGELTGPTMSREEIERKQAFQIQQQHAKQEAEEETRQARERGELPGPTMFREDIESKQAFQIQQQHAKELEEQERQEAIERGELPGPSMAREDIESKQAFEIEQQHRKEEAAEETRQAIERGELPGPSMFREDIESKQAFEIQQQHAKEAAAEETAQARDRGELAGPSMFREEIQREESFQIEQMHAKQEAEEAHKLEVEEGHVPGPAMERENIQRTIQFKSDQATYVDQRLQGQQTDREEEQFPQSAKGTEDIPVEKSAQIQEGYSEPHSPPPAVVPKTPDLGSTGTPTIHAGEWNKVVSQMRSGYCRVSHETSIGAGGNFPWGRMPNSVTVNGFRRHPFTIMPFWNEKMPLHGSEIPETGRSHGCWCLKIHPGFLNGHPPAIKMWTEDLRRIDGLSCWANNYGKTDLPGTTFSSVLLTDDPAPVIKCTNMMDTRSKIIDADGGIHGGEVPVFMRARGAKKPFQLEMGDILSNILNQSDQEAVSQYLIRLINAEAPAIVIGDIRDDKRDPYPEGDKLCYQADIVLQVDRPVVTQRFEPQGPVNMLMYAGFDITLPVRTDYSARIFETPIYLPPKRPNYWDIIYGVYREYPYDEIVLGRLFLLSPTDNFRNTDELGGSVPDGTWVPFVRHNVFWNLNYSSIQQIDVFTHDNSLRWFESILSVLAGGVAWLFAVSVVEPIEATYDLINTAFNQTAVKGQFWTG